MVVDIHTHLGDPFDQKAWDYAAKNHRIPDWTAESYLHAVDWVDRAVIHGFWGNPVNSNECVAQFVREYGDKFIPFYQIDPNSPTALSDIERATQEWGAKGIKLGPIYDKYKPDDEQYFPVYARIEELGLPTMWHQSTTPMAPDGPLEWASPVLLDKVARTFPNLKIVIAHFGYPWILETVGLMRKRPNVYTDVSALALPTWMLYNALVYAVQYRLDGKVFFGSDYPSNTPEQVRESLNKVSSIPEGTNLPPLTREVIDSILNRNSLEILGIR